MKEDTLTLPFCCWLVEDSLGKRDIVVANSLCVVCNSQGITRCEHNFHVMLHLRSCVDPWFKTITSWKIVSKDYELTRKHNQKNELEQKRLDLIRKYKTK